MAGTNRGRNSLRSKSDTGQVNEALCKERCRNIYVWFRLPTN
jgi:hypothetical protein